MSESGTRSCFNDTIMSSLPLARRLTLLALLALSALAGRANPADARCVCRCVNGAVEPICESPLDLPPICSLQICPLVPPAVTPIAPLTIPPVGTTSCQMQQVLDPATGQYEWRQLCH
jgi:hypothetical protein